MKSTNETEVVASGGIEQLLLVQPILFRLHARPKH